MKKNILVLIASILFTSSVAFGERIHTAETSGFLIKDKLFVDVFDDPDIKGVSCYITLPSRSMSFEDQTNSSISCREVGKISGKMVSRNNIFSKKKGIWAKTLVMDRVYDKKRNVLVYVTYTKKMSGDNASSSISVVALN